MSQCDAPGLTPVDEALTRILREVTPIRESEVVPLDQACGRVLAADAISPMNVPPADNSAMDGYAINPGPVDPERTPIGLFRQRGVVLAGETLKACLGAANVFVS